MRQVKADNSTRIELVVPANEAKIRLDQFLAKRLPEFSRSRLQQLIRDGFVRLNNSTSRPRQIVRNGDKIDLTEPPLEKIEALDRKSTRLNSSHGYISYAVFCLKKKKKYYVTRCTFITKKIS